MYLAFYRGGKTWFDKLVKLRTNGEHTHVELVFSPETAAQKERGYGVSFSSSQWDGGTRFKDIEYDRSKWDLVPVNAVSGGAYPAASFESGVREWCAARAGIPYDWRGVLGFMVGERNPGDQDRWFCSEICCAALQQANVFCNLTPSRTSPESLWVAAMARAEVI